jgi:hypothetical protein
MIKSDEEIDEFDMETPFVYIFVREDLPPIQQVIQTAHVTHEAGIKFGRLGNKISHFCIFGVKNEFELMKIRTDINLHSPIHFTTFFEPDFDIGYSAMATGPVIGEERKFFSDYKLLKMKGRFW